MVMKYLVCWRVSLKNIHWSPKEWLFNIIWFCLISNNIYHHQIWIPIYWLIFVEWPCKRDRTWNLLSTNGNYILMKYYFYFNNLRCWILNFIFSPRLSIIKSSGFIDHWNSHFYLKVLNYTRSHSTVVLDDEEQDIRSLTLEQLSYIMIITSICYFISFLVLIFEKSFYLGISIRIILWIIKQDQTTLHNLVHSWWNL